MSKFDSDKPSDLEFEQMGRKLWAVITVLEPLGMVALAILGKDGPLLSQVPLWLLIILALIFGTGVGFLSGWLVCHAIRYFKPKNFSYRHSRLSLLSIAILALLSSWVHWSDVPTNEQIDAIHNNPRFAAAIAEMNEKKIDPALLVAAMKNGHAHAGRYTVFAIEVVVHFIALLFIFCAYWVIFKILCSIFRPKANPTDSPPV